MTKGGNREKTTEMESRQHINRIGQYEVPERSNQENKTGRNKEPERDKQNKTNRRT
jgi:hypothetical protein